ncbi:MAG: RAMP superfamily CRISPR-associated protein [Candidatus Bathyarchaeia archaeon]
MSSEASSPFKSYEILYRLGVKLETLLPLRIGIGREDRVTEPDAPVIKDAYNRPVIPGSTLKGFFRANSERILNSFLDEDKVRNIIEGIFGDPNHHASCIFFGDLKAVKAELDARKHIMINPETGAVQRLFEVEFVKEGAIFQGESLTARNISPCLLGLLYAVKTLTNEQLLRIGGFKSRGYGAVKMEFDKISIIFPGVHVDKLYEGITLTPSVAPSPEGRGPVKFKVSDGVARIEEHGRTVEFRVEARADPSHFGARMESVEAEKMLGELAGVLETALKAWVGGA